MTVRPMRAFSVDTLTMGIAGSAALIVSRTDPASDCAPATPRTISEPEPIAQHSLAIAAFTTTTGLASSTSCSAMSRPNDSGNPRAAR